MFNYYQQSTKALSYKGQNYSSYGTKRIGNFSYSPSDRIGKGFSSVVYKGINDNTKQTVAIKAIDMKGIKDSVSRQMLDCQIQALKTLKHENILKCYDVVRQPSYCYIITQYCNQGDLGEMLKKKKKLTETQTNDILKDIVSGFVQIGKNSFLHRDLKLANIFIHNGKAKIADFGFAKRNKYSSEKEKYNVGSPLYMSPQALKKNIYSLKNDIWSIGIMIYELLHGTTPWQCRTQKQLIDKMTRVPIRFKQTLNLSSDIKDFIRKCLQIDQKRRMSLDDLKDWLTSKGINSSNAQKKVQVLKQKNEENMPKLNLSHKPSSQIQKLKPELSHRNSYTNNNFDKQNIRQRFSSADALPKNIIDKNNGILVNEINTFRLLFKMLQKLKKKFSNEKQLINCIGDQVLKKVKKLKKCCEQQTDEYNIVSIKRYLNEKINPSIKKYKSVIREYFKKYTEQIKIPQASRQNLKDEIRKFLDKTGLFLKQQDQLLIGFWMIQFLGLNKNTTKQKLDSIIDPKLKLNKPYIQQRIRQLR